MFACGRYEGIDQRVLDEAADPDDGPRGVARRLRAQRRRGRRAGGHRGGRPAAARLHGQPGVADRGVARRVRPAGVPRLHQARRLARPRRPAGAAVRRPRPDRRVAPRPGAYDVRPPAARTCCTPAATLDRRGRRRVDGAHRDPGRRRRAAHAAARLLGAPRRRPTRRSTSRRCARTSTTCGPGCATWTTFVVRAGDRLVGAVRGRLDGDDLAHRPADGRPRPAGPRPRPLAARRTSRPRRRRRPSGSSLVTGAQQRRQPADVQEGGLPARAATRPADTGVSCSSASRSAGSPLDFSAGRDAVADLPLASVASRPLVPHGAESRRATCHRGRSARRSRRSTVRERPSTPFRG